MASPEIIYQGDDIDLIITTDESIASPNNLKFLFQEESAAVAAFTKTLGSGIVANNDTQFTVTIDKADTINLAVGNYKIQALYIDSSNKEQAINFNPEFIVIKARLAFV